jgi:hypothetical protein
MHGPTDEEMRQDWELLVLGGEETKTARKQEEKER